MHDKRKVAQFKRQQFLFLVSQSISEKEDFLFYQIHHFMFFYFFDEVTQEKERDCFVCVFAV